MPEGMTAGSYNPETGERRSMSFESVPYVPPDRTGMAGIDPAAIEQRLQMLRADEATKAINAAIQFQGMRGYQKALEQGIPAEKAMAKFGPMIFRSAEASFAPSVRALSPPVPKPTSALDQARIDALRAKVITPPSYVLRSGPRGAENAINPRTLEVKPVIPGEPAKIEESPELKSARRELSKIDSDLNKAHAEYMGIRGPSLDLSNKGAEDWRAKRDALVNLKRQKQDEISALSAAKPNAITPIAPTASASSEVIKIAPNGKRAVFDAATKKFLRYADE